MTDELPPDWAIDEARRRVGHSRFECPAITALARMIAAHEQPPVDPLLIEAREIVANFYNTHPRLNDTSRAIQIRGGFRDKDAEVEQALAAIKRGIEIGKSHA